MRKICAKPGRRHFETDRQAPFGGVIVCNRPMTESLARVICEIFTDVIIAPGFEAEARAMLQKKKNLRLIQMVDDYAAKVKDEKVIRSAPGGFMVMDKDSKTLGLSKLEEKVVTERPPSKDELEAMRFAWRIVRHVKSNAIVFCGKDRTLGNWRRPDVPGRLSAARGMESPTGRVSHWREAQLGVMPCFPSPTAWFRRLKQEPQRQFSLADPCETKK